jgi:hypothetical protein
MKKIIAVLLMMAVFGCSIVSTRLQSTLAPAANIGDSVTCQNGCKNEWERAQLWIAKHSRWKIQLSTDVLIQTFNPTQGDVSYGFSVTKEPAGSGSYVIRMELACGNMFGCDPKPIDVRNAFYYYVKTGVDLLDGQQNLSAIR